MADKKKSKQNYRDVVEIEVAGLGKGRMVRGGMDDKRWAALVRQNAAKLSPEELKALLERERSTDEEFRSRGTPASDTSSEGDAITLRDSKGNVTSIPRLNIPESEWLAKVKRAKLNYSDQLQSATVNGEDYADPEAKAGAMADLNKTRGDDVLRKSIFGEDGYTLSPEIGIDEKTLKALRAMDPDKAVQFVKDRWRNKQAQEQKPAEGEPRVEAGGGSTPMGKFAAMAQEAAKGATPQQSTPEDARVVGPKERLAIESGAPEAAVAEGQRLDTEKPTVSGESILAPVKAVNDAIPGIAGAVVQNLPPVKALRDVDALVAGGGGGVGDTLRKGVQVIGPATVGTYAEGGKLLGQALSPVMPNLGQAITQGSERVQNQAFAAADEILNPPPPQAVTAMGGEVGPKPVLNEPPPMTPEQQAQQEALSLAATMPGGFAIASADPAAKKALAEAQAAHATASGSAKAALKAEADVMKAAGEEAFKLNQRKMQEGEELAAQAAQIRQTHAEEAARHQAAMQATLAAAREAASTPTDPNRFWNNKSDGQKASAVIAGALFGFTGQGMHWLQRLDALVEQDVRMQQADRAARAQGLRDEAAGMGQAAQFALQNGATLAEAKLIEKQAKYESARSALEVLAARTQNSQVQMRAQEMMLAIDAKQVDLAQQGVQLAQMEANNKNTARFHNAQLQQARAQAVLKTAQGAGGQKLEQIRGPQAFQIADLQDAIKTARNMSAEFKNKASGFISKLTALDPTGTTAASEYAAKRGVVVQLVGRALEGGVLREGDIARYNQMIPEPGDLRGDVKWNQLIKELEQRVATVTNTLGAAGFDVGRVQEQVGATLRGGQRLSTEREAE